jgi:hypothetical protein
MAHERALGYRPGSRFLSPTRAEMWYGNLNHTAVYAYTQDLTSMCLTLQKQVNSTITDADDRLVWALLLGTPERLPGRGFRWVLPGIVGQ